jgi:HD superfamily phosphohydrolase YqeK
LGEINTQFEYDPVVLHAHTAAISIAELYPGIKQECIQAIDRHTSAAANMSDLDMIVYVADLIEPTRNFEKPELTRMQNQLREMVGNERLEILFMLHLQMTLAYLQERKAKIVPLSIEAMDDMLMRINEPKHPVWQLARQTFDSIVEASNMEDK